MTPKARRQTLWLCVDCGFNTAPGASTRFEFAMEFAAGKEAVQQRFGKDLEVYTVRNKVWDASGIGPFGGCLCIGCLEKRIGRRLKPKDFLRNHPFNKLPGTDRLLSRRK